MPNIQSKLIYRCPVKIYYQDQDKKCLLASPKCPSISSFFAHIKLLYIGRKSFAFKKLKISGPKCNCWFINAIFLFVLVLLKFVSGYFWPNNVILGFGNGNQLLMLVIFPLCAIFVIAAYTVVYYYIYHMFILYFSCTYSYLQGIGHKLGFIYCLFIIWLIIQYRSYVKSKSYSTYI